ncbi:EVE domain-containing protein [Microvenator marinus]|uniref:EVE domain-containing protein n=1 Tax=Microvenator marinus TaxID=2600177 RepID=A0A5B8XXS1_9DELT|nr:EVE domain-containing protein [Microvenator marinus]QED29987.1 EVE domain-containing protein [Microvenator marinus]
MAYWLFKTEPDEFSLEDLKKSETTRWDSIRNYGARNRLQECVPDDLVLFYHSGRNPAVVGIAKVVSDPYPDPLQFDPESDYFDAKATEKKPRWYAVDIAFERELDQPVTLDSMKDNEALSDLEVLGQPRLSVSRVTEAQWQLLTSSDAEA